MPDSDSACQNWYFSAELHGRGLSDIILVHCCSCRIIRYLANLNVSKCASQRRVVRSTRRKSYMTRKLYGESGYEVRVSLATRNRGLYAQTLRFCRISDYKSWLRVVRTKLISYADSMANIGPYRISSKFLWHVWIGFWSPTYVGQTITSTTRTTVRSYNSPTQPSPTQPDSSR